MLHIDKRRFRLTLASLSLSPLWAASTAYAAAQDLSVTIYANDLALIQDHRTIDLTGGKQRVEFENVSAKIRSETVSLAPGQPGGPMGQPGGPMGQPFSIIEQNFDYDLLTPAKLMEKAVGHEVTIVRTNPGTGGETREKAQVLATNGGVVLKIGDHIEVLRDDGLPARVIFDKVPDNLRAHPTLSVTVNGSKSGPVPVALSYLTPGLGWRADYVALFDEGTSKIDVQGWVTLTNSSGTTYDNARTLLVAGTPAQDNTNDGGGRYIRRPPRPTLSKAGTESGSRERLGDYYLYPLAERTTIADLQTKQVSFLDVHGVPAEHGYEFVNEWLGSSTTPLSAKTVYQFSTSARSGLGDQLPAGILRFYMRDKRGDPQFIGESRIDHTPMGSMLSLATGDAFDVKVQSTVEKRTSLSLFRWRTDMKYVLTNALPKPVTVSLLQSGLWGDTSIKSESQKSTRRNADEAQWKIDLPANGTRTVTATFETEF
ncbi:MAG TPA: DUF4139 domain-containing protein [Steroidobacteraceae bacterium]